MNPLRVFRRSADTASVSDRDVEALVRAARLGVYGARQEWLYQTGQFSRVADPPSNYPEQGTVCGELHDGMIALTRALQPFGGTKS